MPGEKLPERNVVRVKKGGCARARLCTYTNSTVSQKTKLKKWDFCCVWLLGVLWSQTEATVTNHLSFVLGTRGGLSQPRLATAFLVG